MTPGKGKYNALDADRKLMELVKLELAMKKHFVYVDHIDELRHKTLVIRDFDNAISIVGEMIKRLKELRRNI